MAGRRLAHGAVPFIRHASQRLRGPSLRKACVRDDCAVIGTKTATLLRMVRYHKAGHPERRLGRREGSHDVWPDVALPTVRCPLYAMPVNACEVPLFAKPAFGMTAP